MQLAGQVFSHVASMVDRLFVDLQYQAQRMVKQIRYLEEGSSRHSVHMKTFPSTIAYFHQAMSTLFQSNPELIPKSPEQFKS